MLSNSLWCRHCGYDLRGLSADSTCPECGTLISDSIGDEGLASADPAWLSRISRGIRSVVVACGLLVAAFVLILFVDMRFDTWLDARPVVRAAIQDGPRFLVLLFLLVGVLDVVAQEPRIIERERPLATRRLATIAASISIPLLVLRAAFGEPYLRWAIALTFCATVTLLSVHLADLSRRLPGDKLERRCISAAKGFGLCSGIVLACEGIRFVAGSVGPAVFLKAFTGLAGLGVLAFTIESFIAWYAFRRALVTVVARGDPPDSTSPNQTLHDAESVNPTDCDR